MHDPYTPTRYASDALPAEPTAHTKQGMQWTRIFLGGFALSAALLTWSIAVSMLTSMLAWQIAPDRAGFEVAAFTRKIVYFLFAIAAYWWFSAGVRRWRLLHVLLTCGWVQALGSAALLLLVDQHVNYRAWDFWVLAVLPAPVGWALTLLWPGSRVLSLRMRR